MTFPAVTLADWRALVDKELAGKPFDRALVHEALDGLAIQPLYTEAPAPGVAREPRREPFRVCPRQSPGVALASVVAEVDEGADALWLCLDEAADGQLAGPSLARAVLVLDTADPQPVARLERALGSAASGPAASGPGLSGPGASGPAASGPRFALTLDPLARCAGGQLAPAALADAIAALGPAAGAVAARFPGSSAVMVSTLAYHQAGADAVEELALGLSAGACYLEALLAAGLSPAAAASQIAVQVSSGRDTFVELCKVRALRVGWQKLVTAAGAGDAPLPLVHAVCSPRTLGARDPWVNMLRVTTQVFAAVLGGADLVTPLAFDQALGVPSDLGRRVARNTGLVLREESFLGQVADPVGGSYYFDTLTDALARQAWARFQVIEREGGVADALATGRLGAKLEADWQRRLRQLATRRVPVLGVSEFANLGETRPTTTKEEGQSRPTSPGAVALPAHRDAAVFEALRDRAEALATPPEALLVTLGTLAETRPRAGFAAGFFAAGGIRSRESATDERVPLACLCGPDERYAAEAVGRARALKAAGCRCVLVAGRPGALEGELREAGVDGFLYVGSDAVALLGDLLEVFS